MVKPIWILLLLYLFIQRREFSKVKSSTAAISVLLCYKIFLLDFLQQLYGHIWSNLYSRLAKATDKSYSCSSRDTGDTGVHFLNLFQKLSHIFLIPWYKYKHIFRLNRSNNEPHMQTWIPLVSKYDVAISSFISKNAHYHRDANISSKIGIREEGIYWIEKVFFVGGYYCKVSSLICIFAHNSFLAPCWRTPISFRSKQLFHSKLFGWHLKEIRSKGLETTINTMLTFVQTK